MYRGVTTSSPSASCFVLSIPPLSLWLARERGLLYCRGEGGGGGGGGGGGEGRGTGGRLLSTYTDLRDCDLCIPVI